MINVKEGRDSNGQDSAREYAFMSIDRSEYASLLDYLTSKEIKVKNPQEAGPATLKGAAFGNAEGAEGSGESDEGSEDENVFDHRLVHWAASLASHTSTRLTLMNKYNPPQYT